MMDKKFRVPVYNFKVHVTDLEHAHQLDELKDEDKSLGGVVYWHQGKLCVFINTFQSKDIGEYIAHESVHLAYEILNKCGVIVDAGNHESLAYLTEFLYSNIVKILKREKLINEKHRL